MVYILELYIVLMYLSCEMAIHVLPLMSRLFIKLVSMECIYIYTIVKDHTRAPTDAHTHTHTNLYEMGNEFLNLNVEKKKLIKYMDEFVYVLFK